MIVEPTVILVDDEVPFVEAMTRRLSKKQLKLLTALSGEEAMQVLDGNTQVDVVILDVKMPGMGGIETLKQIRMAHPLMEVIMLTGHATVESSIEGMKQGAYDYLMKPCDMEVLLEKVMLATEKKRDHEEKIREAKIKELLSKKGY